MAKRLFILAGLAVLALGLAGFMTGAIGAAFFGTEAMLPAPEVHLAPQQITGDHAGDALHGGTDLILTNTILSSLVASVALLAMFVLGTAKLQLVPGRLQGLIESIVEGLLGFVESVVGSQRSRQVFPIIATIFLFVLFNAWLGLLPIYQSLGVLDHGNIHATLLRPAGTDMNMPLALALVSFFVVEGMGLRTFGFKYLGKFFRFGNLIRGRIGMGIIDVFVGVLELLSEFIRIISFTFRLFGNMTAGEILLLVSGFLVSFVFSVPFYGLELLVGVIQALIFAGLTLVFISVALTPHEHEEGHE